jgi:transcriptional regulator of aromatic amino acid metabolism
MGIDAIPTFVTDGARRLFKYGWLGNVPELENVVYVVLAETLSGASISGEIIDLAINAQF